jgi:chromate transporter
MMRDELVRRRGWLSDERFVDLMGATNLIPGPNSTELAIHLGYDRARWRGLLAAGVCFILPAALIVTALAWAYVEYGSTPAVEGILYGIVPAVIAIIAHALLGLLRSVIKNVWLAGLVVAALVAYLFGVNELLLLAAGRGARRGGLSDPPPAPARPPAQLRRHAAPDRGATGVPRPHRRSARAAVRHPAQDRCGALRQRLRAAGVPARRLRRPTGVDH